MSNKLLAGVAVTVAFTCANFLLQLPVQAVENAASQASKKMLQGKASANQSIDQLEGVGIKCALHEGQPNKLVIEKVRMGSAASYKGVSEGDIVAAVTPSKDGFNLDFLRSGKQYRIFCVRNSLLLLDLRMT